MTRRALALVVAGGVAVIAVVLLGVAPTTVPSAGLGAKAAHDFQRGGLPLREDGETTANSNTFPMPEAAERVAEPTSLRLFVRGPSEPAANTEVAILPWTPNTARLVNTLGGISKSTADGLARRAMTNAEGRIDIPLVELPCFVAAASVALAPSGLLLEDVPDGGVLDVTLECPPACSASGRVTVLGIGGEAGIRVVASAGSSAELFWGRGDSPARTAAMLFQQEARTAADGSFSLHGLPVGNSFLHVEDPRYSADAFYLECATNTDDINLILRPGATIQGVVLTPTGAPVEGAWINATETRGAFDEEQMGLSISDEHGAFQVRTRAGRKTYVRVMSNGQSSYHHPVSALTPGEIREVEIRLPEQANITGRVSDDLGVPLRAMVVAYKADTSQWADAASTDEHGRFKLPRLEAGGTYTVDALPYTADGCYRRVGPIASGTIDLEIECVRPGAIAGQLSYDPTQRPPLRFEDVRVRALLLGPTGSRIEEQTTQANSDGSFAIPVFPGRYRVDAICDGFAVTTEIGLQARAGETTEIDIRLIAGSVVTGAVIDRETRQPVAGAEVLLADQDPNGSVAGTLGNAVETDSHGRFEFTSAPETMDVVVRVRAEGYAPKDARIARDGAGVIELSRSATLRIIAEATPGALAPGIRAKISMSGAPTREVESATSAEVTATGLTPGRVNAQVTQYDDTAVSVTHELTLEPGESHEVRVGFGGPCSLTAIIDPSLGDLNVSSWWLRVWRAGNPEIKHAKLLQGSEGNLGGLVEGPYLAQLESAWPSAPIALTREIDCVPGRRNEVRFANNGVTLIGRIDGRGGRPAAGGKAWIWGPRRGEEWGDARLAKTSDSGEFTLLDLSPGEYEIIAQAPGHTDEFRALDLTRRSVGDQDRQDFQLVEEVRVDVLCRGDGAPAVGATAHVAIWKDGGWEWLESDDTDSTGRVRLRGLPAGRLRALAKQPGRFTELTDLVAVAGDIKDVSFDLRPARDLTVYVTDRQGAAVAKAEITLTAEGFAGDSAVWFEERRIKTSTESLLTDADGALQLRAVPATEVELRVGGETVVVPPGQTEVSVSLR